MLINIIVCVCVCFFWGWGWGWGWGIIFLKHLSSACNGDDFNVSIYAFCLITKKDYYKVDDLNNFIAKWL